MVTSLGHWFIQKVRSFSYAMGFFFRLLFETVTFIKKRQVGLRVLIQQLLFTGVDALGVITLISLTIGAVIIVQGITILPQFGQGDLVYSILITVITREVGPLLTAFIVTARSGTAIATHLGGMVVSHEIEAYVSVGINPISYLVVPRFLGVTISMVLLTIYFNFLGLIGAFFVSIFVNNIPVIEYFQKLLGALKMVDIVSSLLKSTVFGIIISTVATYQGFHVRVASTEVPQIVIKSVGQGFVLCILANIIITLIYYL